jgi:hypothetical protein
MKKIKGQVWLDDILMSATSASVVDQAIATAAGARTSLFVPDQNRQYLAVPHRGNQKAEIRVFEAH